MILAQIKQFLVEKRVVSLTELAAAFQKDPDTLREMLSHWIRKGRLRELAPANHCGGCNGSSCRGAATRYEWIDE